MENNEIIMKLEKEKYELHSKIMKLGKFRSTEEWNKLSVNHKCLLDIQLSAMQTYLETLMSRIVDLKTKESEQEDEKDDDITTIIIIKGETNE
jgi:hypothetical protein